MLKYFLMLSSKIETCRFHLVVVNGFLRRIRVRKKGQVKPATLILKKKRKSKNCFRL